MHATQIMVQIKNQGVLFIGFYAHSKSLIIFHLSFHEQLIFQVILLVYKNHLLGLYCFLAVFTIVIYRENNVCGCFKMKWKR